MEKFQIIQPSPVLAPYVKHYWLLESDDVTSTQRVIPTGNVELVFHRGHQMIGGEGKIPRTSVCGQSISFVDLVPTGVVNMIAVVFHPFGARAFFELPVSELSGLTVAGDDLEMASLRELEDQVMNTADDGICIQLIESFLMRRMNPFKEYNYKRMITAIREINLSGGEISVTDLAGKVCLGGKQFQRIFNEYVGASPKEFMRIVRFHKALFTLQQNPSMSFTRLAYECGYYDQAHLTNEFKLFSGYTPSEYVAICAPYSDYFS